MAKAIVAYESKYGNTKLAAEIIVEGMNQVSGTGAMLTELNDVDLTQIGEFDIVLVGSPNHMGGATRSIRKFIDKLGELKLENKQTAVFDTYLGGDFEKAVKKMEKQIGEKAPGLKLISPGLSIRVDGMKGPITDGELPKCKEFGIRIATLMKE
ncbi:MAG: flavodoxin domain-containing protein [Deltaproteobacteria bacterium]|nr:flavodoxin domain-containing protein [Deltaproteobacteria bacterium]